MALLEALVAQPAPLAADDDGVLRVGGTRVSLDTVLAAFQAGCDAEAIRLKYPALKVDDIYAVMVYYLWNRAAIDRYLAERRRLAEQVRRENEARFPPDGVRERLLARRSAKS